MKQVLKATETTGTVWHSSGRDCSVAVTDHSGGTLTVEFQAPDGTWIGLDVTFIDDGIKDFTTVQGAPYRITGGTVGAKAWTDGSI